MAAADVSVGATSRSAAQNGRVLGIIEDLRRPLLGVAVVFHVLFVVAPLDVLAPVDPHEVGRQLLDGKLPYEHFQFEYPPLAVLPFLFAGLVPEALALSTLALQALLLEAVVFLLVIRRHVGAPVRFAVLATLTFPFLSGGFDAYMVASLALATELLSRSDPRGWWIAAVGVPIKLASVTTWVWGRTRLGVAVVAGAVAAAVAVSPAMLVGLTDQSWLGYSLHRGTQAESVAASSTWVARTVQGRDVDFEYRFRAWELVGADVAAAIWLTIGICVLIAIALVGFRFRLDPWMASYASVLVLLVSNKVLSPQFLAWAVPLAAVLGGRWFWAHLVMVVLTLGIYVADLDPVSSGSVVILVRNVVLVSTAAGAVAATVRIARRAGPSVTARR